MGSSIGELIRMAWGANCSRIIVFRMAWGANSLRIMVFRMAWAVAVSVCLCTSPCLCVCVWHRVSVPVYVTVSLCPCLSPCLCVYVCHRVSVSVPKIPFWLLGWPGLGVIPKSSISTTQAVTKTVNFAYLGGLGQKWFKLSPKFFLLATLAAWARNVNS